MYTLPLYQHGKTVVSRLYPILYLSVAIVSAVYNCVAWYSSLAGAYGWLAPLGIALSCPHQLSITWLFVSLRGLGMCCPQEYPVWSSLLCVLAETPSAAIDYISLRRSWRSMIGERRLRPSWCEMVSGHIRTILRTEASYRNIRYLYMLSTPVLPQNGPTWRRCDPANDTFSTAGYGNERAHLYSFPQLRDNLCTSGHAGSPTSAHPTRQISQSLRNSVEWNTRKLLSKRAYDNFK